MRWGGVRPGLDEGEVSRSRDAAALLELLKQLLQSLHVEPVIVVHLLLGGLRALGHRDGAARCRDGGTGRGGASAAHTVDGVLLRDRHSPTVVMGLAKGTGPQDLAEKRRKEMQGEMARNFLKVMLPGVRGKSLNSEDVILPKGVHGHQEGAGKVGRQERRGLVRSAALGGSPHSSPTGSHFPRPSEANDGAPKKYLEEGTYIS